ncbi:MAG: signal protein [Rhodoferax sp.]|nr:signal protein [Rhodoferax sp.]
MNSAKAAVMPAPKASAPAAATAPAKPAMTDTKAAAGGGAGKVWVNSSSKTYHCEGSKFYGKTKTGEYMTEAEAKAKGNHAVKGKACAK